MRRTICVLLLVAVCLFSASCKDARGKAAAGSSGKEEEAGSEQISLLYSQVDSFNPYTAKTKLNRQISRLLYDPLIKCDNEFNPVYCLAEDTVLDGKTCTVTLKSAQFTDGTPLTAQDVIYSYNSAIKSDTAYKSSLYEVSSVAVNGNTVVFTLTQFDPYFLNLLDFPIIKESSGGQKNEDGVEISPVGCGRYCISQEENALIRNENYYGKKGAVSTIKLINAPDETSVSHYVEVGTADIYYADESTVNVARMSGKRVDVNTNSFVYIGINENYAPLTSSTLRYAISAAINRKEICHSAYFDNATPAGGFFNPVIKETQPVQSLKTVSDFQITIENLSKIGYNRLDSGYYVNDAGKHLTLTLLVNSDNSSRVAAAKLISSQCAAAGIEINVVERSYSEYMSMLSLGSFQLYLGEIRIPANMDMSALTVPGGSASYGVKSSAVNESTGETVNTVCAEMTDRYHKGECSLCDLAGAYLTEMPQIPVCYRNGMLFYTSRIKDNVEASLSDIFFSFNDYQFK